MKHGPAKVIQTNQLHLQTCTQDFGWGVPFTKLRWTFPDIQQTATHSPMMDPGFQLGVDTHSQIVSTQNAMLGGLPPQENFRPSEIVSGAVSGQN